MNGLREPLSKKLLAAAGLAGALWALPSTASALSQAPDMSCLGSPEKVLDMRLRSLSNGEAVRRGQWAALSIIEATVDGEVEWSRPATPFDPPAVAPPFPMPPYRVPSARLENVWKSARDDIAPGTSLVIHDASLWECVNEHESRNRPPKVGERLLLLGWISASPDSGGPREFSAYGGALVFTDGLRKKLSSFLKSHD